ACATGSSVEAISVCFISTLLLAGARRLGLDDRLDAVALARGHLVKVRALIDEDVVAGDLVAAAVDARVVVEVDLLVAVVELDAQRLAFDPDALLLARLGILALAEACRLAGRGGELEAFSVLAHNQAIGAEADGPLGDDDIALEDVQPPRVVGAHLVRLDLRGLVAVGLLAEPDHRENQQHSPHERALHSASFGPKRATTALRSTSSRVSLLYSMPRPCSERPPSTILTSRSVRTSERSRSTWRNSVVMRASGPSAEASGTSSTPPP